SGAADERVIAAHAIDGVGKAGAGNAFAANIIAVDNDRVDVADRRRVEHISSGKCAGKVQVGKRVRLVCGDVDGETGVTNTRFVDDNGIEIQLGATEGRSSAALDQDLLNTEGGRTHEICGAIDSQTAQNDRSGRANGVGATAG